MKKATMLAAALAATLIARAETTVIEAEWFEDWGGWVNDTQFMDQMGSPYLLAHGLGKPVADAKMSFFVKNGSIVPASRRLHPRPEPHPQQGLTAFRPRYGSRRCSELASARPTEPKPDHVIFCR